MDEILLLLFKQGATHPIRISTPKIGRLLGMSQQNASRRLIELERSGLIERKRNIVYLTPHAIEEIAQLYQELRAGFEDQQKIKLRGKIVDGLREGAYYLSLPGYRSRLKKALGFDPYPGTLNLKLNGKGPHILPKKENAIFVPGFELKNRSFGSLYAYPCSIEGIKGALLRPIRTHHGKDIIELIASVPLKKKLKKKDKDWVTVEML